MNATSVITPPYHSYCQRLQVTKTEPKTWIAISLQQALEIMIINGARTLNMADHIGCLKQGMSADFAVLDRQLETSAAEDIAQIQVLQTVFEDKVMFE